MLLAQTPLARHNLFSSSDREDAQARVAAVFCPHRLGLAPRTALVVEHNHVALDSMSVNYLAYGGDVSIDPEMFEEFYLLQIPLAGHAVVRVEGTRFVAGTHTASITNPSDTLSMRWSADCGKLIVRIDGAAIDRHVAALLDRPVTREVRFRPCIDGAGPASTVLRTARFVMDELQYGGLPSPLMRRQMEQMIVSSLVERQPHTYSDELFRAVSRAAPRHVRRAEDFIVAHAHDPITIEDICAASGASARSLYKGFRDFRDTSPMEHLRNVRMERAHETLCAPEPADTVTSIATRWGFFQFGRFAGRYRELYGEPPSVTLRRAREHAGVQ
jgi:AraC-like DNA-binding protein